MITALSPIHTIQKNTDQHRVRTQKFQHKSGFAPFSFRGDTNEEPPLTILHLNDTHRKFWPLAKIKTAYQDIQKSLGGNTIKTLSGDYSVGSDKKLFDINVQLINKIGLDIATLGNHEFDAGVNFLADSIEKSNFSIVDSNLVFDTDSKLKDLYQSGKIKPARILEINGSRYGFIGISPINLEENMAEDLPEISVFNEKGTLKEIQREIDKLKANNIHKIILLSHAGYNFDKVIAQNIRGVDVILGGHSHSKISGIKQGKTLLRSPVDEPVLIMQAGHGGEYLGVMQVVFNKEGILKKASSQLEDIKKYPDNKEIQQLEKNIFKGYKPLAYVGSLISDDSVERGEHPVGDVVTDAIRSLTGSHVALMLGGNIRGPLKPGPVTEIDIVQLLPFDDKIVKYKVKGQYLIDVLNVGAKSVGNGSFYLALYRYPV